MRGKRSKQYRKLMHQYELSFNFRVPYQVLIDADMIKDTYRFKMNLPLFLERTLHGQVKPSTFLLCTLFHSLLPINTTLSTRTKQTNKRLQQ
jgi:hypothetical protein